MFVLLADRLLKLIGKILPKREYRYVAKVSLEDAIQNINYLAHSLRKVTRRGVGITLFPTSFAIKQGYKTVILKERKGVELFAFEKWLKENYRLINGKLNEVKRMDFLSLPHVDGAPRIVILAEYIVNCSGGDPDRRTTESIVRAFNAVTPLSYVETDALKASVTFVILREIAVLAEKCTSYYSSYHAAGKRSARKCDKDSYYYFRELLHPKEKEVAGKDRAASRLAFENILAANEKLISTYINALRHIEQILPRDSGVLLSKVNDIYSADEDYRSMNHIAQSDYLQETYLLSVERKTSETAVADAVMTLAKEHGVHFGKILYKQKEAIRAYLCSGKILPLRDETKKVQGGYCAAVLILSLLIAAFPAYYLRNVAAYCSVLPIFIAALHPVEYFLKRLLCFRKGRKALPEMEYTSIPEKCRTVVVVSRFIRLKEDVDDAIKQIETLACSLVDPNVSYAVVADMPSSKEEMTEEDKSLLDYIRQKKLSKYVGFFVRKRVLKKGMWVAYERKRGALIEFLSAISTGDMSRFTVFGNQVNAQFALLLDDDSEVLPGTLRSAISAMAHPLNSEYDLMSFGGRINRYSLKTYYSERFARSCAIDAYPFYSDFYSDRFDRALYCGKAIVRVEPFLRKLKDFFPDDRILSHDIIEGAVLRSVSLKRCVYEDAPRSFAADVSRTMRWHRGDVQLLPYALCDHVRTKDGGIVKNPIDAIYKLVIFINGVSVLADFSVSLVILFGILLGVPFLILYAASVYLAAYLFALVDEGKILFSRIRFRHALIALLANLRTLAERVFLLPYRALIGLYVFVVTTFKMIIRSDDLLSWVPFRMTQEGNGIEEGAKVTLPALILLCIFAIYTANFFVLLYTVLSGMYLILLLLSGRERTDTPCPKEETLLNVAKKIYRYFRDRADDGLITDNIQLFPYAMHSKMTSPTDLGFALLAEVAACKLRIIDESTAIANIKKLIEKTEKMEKWNGHLYNWYNITTFEPMPPKVVSSVDSSNFLACLIVAKNFARETGDDVLFERIEAIIHFTDFTALIDPVDHMLAIVYNVSENACSGKYDLLASEARLAYLIAIAKGADPKGYFSLGREYSTRYGNTLLSWSGTAFEYMLPRIFVKSPKGSLMDVQERNSGRAQMADKTEDLFGRSECGYRDFDNSTAYRYKAVGVSSIALSGESTNVIAPYASFLYLPCFPEACIENLKKMTERGIEGEYGYYEAIDFDHNGDLVKSFMTHHQGMSLAAIANALTGDEIVRLFSEDPAIRSVRLLNAEENEYRMPPKVYTETRREDNRANEVTFSLHEPAELFWDHSDDHSLVLDTLGRGYTRFGRYFITKYCDYKAEKGGVFFQVKEEGRLVSPTFYPSGDESCFATISERCIRYSNPKAGLVEECSLLHGYNGELRKLIIRNDADELRAVEISVYADIVLNTKDAYESHPAFSDMFVRAEYDDETQSAVLYRKNEKCEVSVAAVMSLKGVEDLKYNCNRYNVYGRTRFSHEDIAAGVANEEEPPFGDILYPCFAASGKVTVLPHSEAVVYCYLIAGADKATVKVFAERLDAAYKTGVLELLGRRTDISEYDIGKAARLGGELLHLYPSEKTLRALRENAVIMRSLAPEEKIVYYEVDSSDSEKDSVEIARITKGLQDVGIMNRLVIGTRKMEGTVADSLDRLREILSKVNDRVIIIDLSDASIYKNCAHIDLSRSKKNNYPILRQKEVLPQRPENAQAVTFTSGEGGFTSDGYRVIPFRERTLLPYSNVIAGKEGGFVITESGGGFTFGRNAREDKLTVWTGDVVEDFSVERLYVIKRDKKYLLTAGNCTHKVGMTTFETEIDESHIILNVYLIESGKSKVYEIIMNGEPLEEVTFSFEFFLALDWRYSDEVMTEKYNGDVRFLNVRTGKECFLHATMPLDVRVPSLKSDPFAVSFVIQNAQGSKLFLSSAPLPKMSDRDIVISRASTLSEMSGNAISIESGIESLDILYNTILPYQVQSARLNAKTGYSQCGGATGFRDQLQDVLSLLISDPKRVREQLLISAAHQYREGDVQHWWHEPRIGVRTRISDDKLWLPYVTAKYIAVTEDHGVLDEVVPFLDSPVLSENEMSRYEIPSVSERKPLSEHILRAIRNALDYGEHDLLKIGTGDWNDGLDRVGAKGRGESVWLTMFAYTVIRDCMTLFPENVRKEFAVHLLRMKNAIGPLMRDGRYPLCFTDNGEWLGYVDTSACTLSLNPQTWSVFSGIVPREEALRALATAKSLVDPFLGIVRISTPPFDEKSNYGYIAAYPKGVRENGGQYTHAAVWYLKALWETGQAEEAFRLLMLLDPVEKCRDTEKAIRYKGEPYVLSGDVYSSSDHPGRAGWSWYTGSAAWLKYSMTEDFLGIKKRGNKIYLAPCFPQSFRELKCKIVIDGKTLHIYFLRAEKARLIVNGQTKDHIDIRETEGDVEIISYFT